MTPTPPPLPPVPAPVIVNNLPTAPPPVVNVPTVPPPVHDFWSWLYDSSGSLVGALVTLIAAGIAYRAVSRQIKAGRKATTDQITASNAAVAGQIKANNVAVANQIKASNDAVAKQIRAQFLIRQREERLGIVNEAVEMLFDSATWPRMASGDSPEAQALWEQRKNADDAKVLRLQLRMQLLGMQESHDLLRDYWDEWRPYAHGEKMLLGPVGMSITQKMNATANALLESLGSLDDI